jgi:hypothetical protein
MDAMEISDWKKCEQVRGQLAGKALRIKLKQKGLEGSKVDIEEHKGWAEL